MCHYFIIYMHSSTTNGKIKKLFLLPALLPSCPPAFLPSCPSAFLPSCPLALLP